MSDTSENIGENLRSSSSSSSITNMTLYQAVDMGEYHPSILSKFNEWNSLSEYLKLELVKKGADIRMKKMRRYWSTVANLPYSSSNEEIQKTLTRIQNNIVNLERDIELLFIEFSKKL